MLSQDKYRYTVLPQGAASSCDLFNLITDEGIRNTEGHYKNIDDNQCNQHQTDGRQTP